LAPCFVTSFSDLYLLEEDIDRLLAAGRGDLLEHSENGFRLRLRPDLSCAAFREGLCSIHTIRPAICRAFPFDFDVFAGLVLISKCPGVNAGWSEPEDFRDAIDALQSVYRRWMTFTADRLEAAIAPTEGNEQT
jgi:Fe-S-cluster containining protein